MPPSIELGLEAATDHPLNPEQSLDMDQALWAFTRGAALAAGWDDYGIVLEQCELPGNRHTVRVRFSEHGEIQLIVGET